VSLFVDTSAWYAAADCDEANHDRMKQVLGGGEPLLTTDHVLVETWWLLRHRIHRAAAEAFWGGLRSGVAFVEPVREGDLDVAWAIGEAFPDQDFSLVDRTSFAVMERLGVQRVASLDDHFAVYRFGPGRRRAFDVVR
jgi:predicted nucleic acid-binding protein